MAENMTIHDLIARKPVDHAPIEEPVEEGAPARRRVLPFHNAFDRHKDPATGKFRINPETGEPYRCFDPTIDTTRDGDLERYAKFYQQYREQEQARNEVHIRAGTLASYKRQRKAEKAKADAKARGEELLPVPEPEKVPNVIPSLKPVIFK
jgi:hypothetical protein